MTEQERLDKAINGLEQFIADFKPFCGNKADWQRVCDALALLKAQEPVKPNTIMHGKMVMYYQCPSCLATIDPSDNFCRRCGRAVKWDDDKKSDSMD